MNNERKKVVSLHLPQYSDGLRSLSSSPFVRPSMFINSFTGAKITKKGYTLTKKVIYLRTINRKGYFMMHLKLKEFFEKKGISQLEIADALGVSPPYINAILNGKKPIGKKNAERLANLYGISKSFLLTGEGEIEGNEKAASPAKAEPADYIDPSSQVNATISAYIEAIASLKRELRTKNELLAEKDARIAEKDERITELKAHNVDLRRQLNQYQNSDIDRYPFPVGSAEPDKHQTKIK